MSNQTLAGAQSQRAQIPWFAVRLNS